jgi:prepilin-type processing-associated H-X9-DG protein
MASTPPPVTSPDPFQVPRKRNTVLIWMLVVTALGGGLCLVSVMAAILFPVFSQARHSAQQTLCMSNLKSLTAATILYSNDNNGILPGEHWMDSIKTYQDDPVVYACPVQRRMDPKSYGYALSQEVSGKLMDKFHPSTPAIFDSVAVERNAVAAPTGTPNPGRHNNGRKNNVSYVDGSVRSVGL